MTNEEFLLYNITRTPETVSETELVLCDGLVFSFRRCWSQFFHSFTYEVSVFVLAEKIHDKQKMMAEDQNPQRKDRASNNISR